MGKLKAIKEAVEAASKNISAGSVLYHGTRGQLDPSKNAPLFLTNKMIDADAYARGIIPGTSRGASGDPRVIKFTVSDNARLYDGSDVIDETVMGGGDVDRAVAELVSRARANGDDFVYFMHPSVDGDDMEVYIPVHPFGDDSVLLEDDFSLGEAASRQLGKNDLLGSVDPRLLAPVAAVGAGAGYAMRQYAPPPLPPLDPAYAEFARRREAKRDTWRQLKEGVFTMGSAMAGGIVGDLSRLGGYLNPFMSVEQTEQGAQGIENAMIYQPTGPNRYLEGLSRGIEQAQEDFAPLTDQIPNSIPGRAYNALPERAQGLIRILADMAL